jgi:hypothetical protein
MISTKLAETTDEGGDIDVFDAFCLIKQVYPAIQ